MLTIKLAPMIQWSKRTEVAVHQVYEERADLDNALENADRDVHGVVLYATRIVDWSGETIKLYTGGYRTVSTKAHINEVLKAIGCSAHVFQHKSVWYIQYHSVVSEFAEGFELPKRAS